MPRKRLLPKYVSSFRDRHGKERLRFRRQGHPPAYIRCAFGTEGFREEYRALLDGTDQPRMDIGRDRVEPGTVEDLIVRYYRSTKWLGRTEKARDNDRRTIEAFRAAHGHRLVAQATPAKLDAIVAAKASTPTAANKLRKTLRRLFAFAAHIGMTKSNPAQGIDRVNVPAGGFHAWTEEEIAKYQARHPIGTTARLALELMLWTGQRRGDAIRMGPKAMRDGCIRIVQEKTGKALSLPIAPQLLAAIVAVPVTGAETFLVSAYGKPFTSAGFGMRMRNWCDQAGLLQCAAHGLRKAASRRLAEIGISNQGIKAVTGHSGDSEVALYTREADQAGMAAKAIAALAEWEMANQSAKVRHMHAKGADNG